MWYCWGGGFVVQALPINYDCATWIFLYVTKSYPKTKPIHSNCPYLLEKCLLFWCLSPVNHCPCFCPWYKTRTSLIYFCCLGWSGKCPLGSHQAKVHSTQHWSNHFDSQDRKSHRLHSHLWQQKYSKKWKYKLNSWHPKSAAVDSRANNNMLWVWVPRDVILQGSTPSKLLLHWIFKAISSHFK